jgi:N6-adenosine-specific RNA methylase IME4
VGQFPTADDNDDCILWFWTTNHHMRLAYQVLDAWGFQEKTILTWVKDRMGRGDWLRGQTEHCIVAVRGKPIVELTNQTTVLHGPLRANSQKPVQFYDLVESLCPAPRYADLFSRYRHNEKWDRHGDQAPHYDAINDINKSVAEGFAAIKQRKAAGGPGWKGHDAPSLAPGDPGEMPAFLRRDGGGDE